MRWQPGRQAERGFATVQYVTVMAFSLLTLVLLVNFVAFQYGRGVVRAALDEGTRAGSRVEASEEECELRAQEVLDDLLGGPMGDTARDTLQCEVLGGRVRAVATASFASWIDPVPTWSFEVEAVAVKELP